MGSLKDRENKKNTSPTEQVIIGLGNVADDKPKGRPKSDKETKQRATIAIRPSVLDNLQKIAYVKRKSVSEILESLASGYISDNADMLELYEKLSKVK